MTVVTGLGAFLIKNALTSQDVLVQLRSANVIVPPRGIGRKRQHPEISTICHLMATLATSEQLAYPISVTHRDRPDFLLQIADSKVGVEVTEAITEQFANYSAHAARECLGALVEPTHFRWGAPAPTRLQMDALFHQTELSSDGWAGNSAEKEWALAIQHFVDQKLEKLAHPDFERFGQNWLAIYDNLPLPHFDLEKAVSFLAPLIANRWTDTVSFDSIFVACGTTVVRLTARGANYLPDRHA